jgi:hypothetical protein
MAHSTNGRKVVYISAKTGKYVPETYALKHPATTVKMHVKIGMRKT